MAWVVVMYAAANSPPYGVALARVRGGQTYGLIRRL
jgi:hypothetical protein